MSRGILDPTEHLKMHGDDHHTRRGLMALVGCRRMPAYLKGTDCERLGLRR